MIKDNINNYGLVTKIFHWAMSIIIISMIAVGYYMSCLPNSPDKFAIYRIHKAIGVLVLFLTFLRLIWKIINISPKPLPSMHKLEMSLYKIGIFFLYLFMFAMPISGVLMSLFSGRDIDFFNLFTIYSFAKNDFISSNAYQFHTIGVIFFIILISGHILIALFHHFFLKDKLLMRMIKNQGE